MTIPYPSFSSGLNRPLPTIGAAIAIAMTLIGVARAQVKIPEEYEKTVKATQVIGTLGADLFGDSTSFYTGATSFSVVDVSLPGNSGLPIEARRSFSVENRDGLSRSQLLSRDGSFGEWDLEIPYLQGIFAFAKGWQVGGESGIASNMRCSLSGVSEPEAPIQGSWLPQEYWNGNNLHVPGGGDQEILLADVASFPKPNDGKTYIWLTNNQWYFSCIPGTANGVAGDAFLAIDPQGNRYYFDWIVKRITTGVKRPGGGSESAKSAPSAKAGFAPMAPVNPVNEWTSLTRERVRIYPTKIEDRFGNYVHYTYDAANPWRLLSMTANDGRSLTFGYNTNGHISSVTDGSRTWTYVYGDGLTEVRLPDQSKWLINFASLRAAETKPDIYNDDQCETSGASGAQDIYVGTMTHPSGAVGEFKFQSRTHGRSYVPKRCIPTTPTYPYYYTHANVPFLFNSVAIIEKKISGPGIAAPATWTYTYGAPNNSWLENCGGGCASSKTVEISGPTGNWMRYTLGNRYKYNEGKVLKVERGSSSSSILNSAITMYQHDPTGLAYPARIGRSLYSRGDYMSELLIPVVQRSETQQGRTFGWQVAANCNGYALCFDPYARPIKVVKSSSP